jgi:diguanylate cyclase (GGDEF)-like protein
VAETGIYKTFKRGVGRRILGLFMLAGILPVIFTAFLAYTEIGRNLETEVSDDLRHGSKTYGIEVISSLQRASEKAGEIAKIANENGLADVASREFLLNDFESVWYLEKSGINHVVYGSGGSTIPLSSINTEYLSSGSTQLVFARGADSLEIVLLRALPNDSRDNPVVAFRLKAEKVWPSPENLPYATDFCVFTTTGDRLHCTQGMPDDADAALIEESDKAAGAPSEWQLGGETYFVASWQLFLDAPFKAPALNIVASQAKTHALKSSADFSRVFVPALALVVLLVGALSFNLIGESLVPLQRLTIAARQYASGNMGSRVRVRTGDEFEWLADAFNTMATKMGGQIETLQAMSEIDQLILSGAKFEDVSEGVIRQISAISGCDAAGVIARDDDSQHWAKMISSHDGDFRHERMALPKDVGHQWCQPRQVELSVVDPAMAPYKACFESYGQNHVVLIPIVLNDDLKGVMLLGFTSQFDMKHERLQRCIDLAGRFAVALASVEREEALYRQAHFDELTGLPNRQLLKDRLDQQIVYARREGHSGAVLFLDLDRFKEINDIHGHSVGDIVLMQAAKRIVAEVRGQDTVARLGGDEFVVVLPRLRGSDTVRATASRLLNRLTEAFAVHGTDHFVSASIGVVLFPDDGDSVETLLKNADAAMYRAKDAGRARFEFFSKELNAESRRKISLERDLRSAFQNDELEVYYQPQFDISTGVISGAEALLRWKHDEHGSVSPAEFIPLAEDSSLIVEIGQWVIEQTCKDLRRILDMGFHPGPMSINVSARQLREKGFTGDVLEPLHRLDIHPGYLQLEVTETTVAQNRDTAIDILSSLRAEGVRVAIDDFGTGYSSLSYLQQMPFDVIKIDKSFIDLIGAGDNSDNICRTIIRMAHELGKTAIAEGVESQEQIDFLTSNRCDIVQGYYYSYPLTYEDFSAFVQKQDFHTQRRKALEIV